VFPGPTDFAANSTEELARVFGHEGLETEVFNADLDRWSGPIRSGLGWHLVYVSSKQPPRLQSFEAARDVVRRDYLDAARARRNAQTYQELRKNFVIERE
jgi:parvulin-like peptidyl-prolyl isomerase